MAHEVSCPLRVPLDRHPGVAVEAINIVTEGVDVIRRCSPPATATITPGRPWQGRVN